VTTLGWLRFEWDLKTLPAEESNVPAPFMLRGAEKNERDVVESVVANAFSMDTGWSDIQRMFGAVIVRNVQAGFASDPPGCIVILHGQRIIAASVVNSREEVENHLATGPCVLQEYRGRGFGTVLFRTSLATLRESGLSQAYGMSREKSTAARFLYPKFGGTGSRWTPDFEVAQRIAA
jgi:GNAT superfamily N-acetyltransferase